MQIIYKKIDELIPYENNPRHNDQAVEAVAESIRQFGFRNPIIIDKDNVIVAGHTRQKAAKQLGMTEVPCIMTDDLADEQVRAYRLVDNKTNELSSWAFDLLGSELDKIEIDMSSFGFDAFDIDDLGDTFSLPDGDRQPFTSMTFALADEQAELINHALGLITSHETNENYGNENNNGNKLYAIIKEWLG